ncbi:MAG: polyprenyl synthetase family protein, partial [Deltaproteobacteria bacterium]|nr:polyprenyl synthetase family protein [Deltaproteobacteria bacterium]
MRFENIFGRRTLAKVNRELLSYNIGLLKEFLADTIGRNTEMTVRSLQKGIFSPESEFLKRGGKRWRVALFDTVVDILGGSKNDLRKYSVVCELIHNGTLIADDIEDGSLLRRGKPSLHLIYGTDISVNLSQFLYFFPLVPLLEIRDHGLFARLMKIYTEEMISVSAGQAID